MAAAAYLVSPLSSAKQAMQIAAWLALPASLFLAAGCGGGSDKKPKQSTTVAQNEQGKDEETDAAPPPVKKKPKAAQKPAAPEPPAASTTDVRKWNIDDLNAALARKDVQFVFGVLFFGMSKPNDAKRAQELDSLVQKVARLKDDPVPEVPIPAGAFAEADTEPLDAAAKTATTAAAPGAAAGPRRSGSPFRGGARRGDGGK
jgi:hypothetical protein